MKPLDGREEPGLPPRAERPGGVAFVLYVVVAAFIATSFWGAGFSPVAFVEGLPSLGRLLADMFPPDLGRLAPVLQSLLETFQMAVAGAVTGVILSLPVAVFASRKHAPHPALYMMARGLVAFARTVPDLIWALIFVVMVGLGPFAGTLAIAVDTIGFCGRFFAEAMEETDDGPQEALTAIGATRTGVIATTVIPNAMPSLIATALYSLELATRSSVVLGLVGAGGIGMELKVSMDLFRYQEALTIILAVFVLVLAVERGGSLVRANIIGDSGRSPTTRRRTRLRSAA